MSYIGRTPQSGNFQVCDAITPSATATYNLLVDAVAVSPETANHCIVSLNGVIQAPTSAFTISGSTIVFASALTSADVIDFIHILGSVLDLGVPSDNTVSTAKIVDGAVTSAKLTYPLTTFSSTGIDDNATSTAITIDSSENVGIGIANPSSYDGGANKLVLGSTSGRSGLTIVSSSSTAGGIYFADGTTGTEPYSGFLDYDHDDNAMRFFTNGSSERMRIDSSGNVLVGKTSTSDTVTGSQFTTNGSLINILNGDGYNIINKQTADGVLIYFKQANSTEGNISVSGTTVSYNGFTGTHWSRFQDNSTPTILRGTVLETLDEMCDWYNLEFDIITQDENNNDVTTPQKIPHVLLDTQSNGDVITYNHEGTDVQATIVKEGDVKHMMSKVSDTVDAKNVYGVFSAYDLDGEGYNDFYVASVGTFVVRIKSGQTIAKGDLLQSNGDGTAKVQSDDNVKSSSFAKVLSTTKIETYDDGSFIVPCSLMS